MSKGPTGRATSFFALVFVLLQASVAIAQNTVTLQGRVVDATGKPLVGAQIAVLNAETNQQRGALSRADGSYSIVGLPPGDYMVSVKMLGFGTADRKVRVSMGQVPTLTFQLMEEAVALKAVEVEATREARFEVKRKDVSAPVVTAEIVNLPLNTRNTMNLAAIVPGVKTFAPTAGRSLPSSGSLPDLRFWNFYLDGVEWKSFFNGNLVGIPQTGSPLPQEAMREFRVHLNPYDAAYTRGSSFVISAASQRGTNELHGSAFIYGQNNDLNAHDLFQRRSRAASATYKRADYDRSQFGFNVRGPIQHDKTFFAASYEGQSTDNTLTVVPRHARWNQFGGDFAAPTKNHTGVLRLTHAVNPEHTADLTYATRYYDSETNYGATLARNAGITATYKVHSVQLRDTYTPSANLVNELSLNFLSWFHNEAQLQPGLKTEQYPGITFGTAGFPLELKETTFRLVDRLTYSLGDGRHTITAGAEVGKVNVNAWLPANRDGFFSYTADTSSLPNLGRIGIGVLTGTEEDARAKSAGWTTGLYLQDQWKVRNNLELTYGLRWDVELNTLNNDFVSPFASDPVLTGIPALRGFLANGDRKNDLNNFAPRVSFDWDVRDDGRTHIRGGGGIMYDRITTFMAFFEKQTAAWRSYDFNNPGTNDPAVLRQRVQSGQGTSVPNLNLLKTDMKTPYNIQYSIGLGQEIMNGLAFNADYIHQDAKNLYVQTTPNWFNTVTRRRNLTDRYGTITLYDDFGEAQFDAVVGSVTYDRPGLRLNGAYTFGWYKSEFEGLGGYNDQTFFVMQPSTGDERARFVLSGVGDLPYGFKLSAVSIFATPRPYVATDGRDLNTDNNFNNDFLNGLDERVVRPESKWENMYRTVDVRFAKRVQYRDHAVSVHLEGFNVFNWDNLSTFAGRQRNADGSMRTDYGTVTGVYAPRQMQVGLRYEF